LVDTSSWADRWVRDYQRNAAHLAAHGMYEPSLEHSSWIHGRSDVRFEGDEAVAFAFGERGKRRGDGLRRDRVGAEMEPGDVVAESGQVGFGETAIRRAGPVERIGRLSRRQIDEAERGQPVRADQIARLNAFGLKHLDEAAAKHVRRDAGEQRRLSALAHDADGRVERRSRRPCIEGQCAGIGAVGQEKIIERFAADQIHAVLNPLSQFLRRG
jgi:hypothetical protein